jgi:hypothetical protein
MAHHFEVIPGNRQPGVGAVDAQDPEIETGESADLHLDKPSSPVHAASIICRCAPHSAGFL